MVHLKSYVKKNLPFIVPWLEQLWCLRFAGKSHQQVFTEIFQQNLWLGDTSHSGPGSSLAQTAVIRQQLPEIMHTFNCHSLLDIPCGDFFWMSRVEIKATYIGADIVDELIRRNQQHHARADRTFIHLDVTQDQLPGVDLILCRDCFVHLSHRRIAQAVAQIKASGSVYLLATTFVDVRSNRDTLTGGWRPLNLQLPPFNFPPPILLINEQCPDEGRADKSLGLWKIDNLK